MMTSRNVQNERIGHMVASEEVLGRMKDFLGTRVQTCSAGAAKVVKLPTGRYAFEAELLCDTDGCDEVAKVLLVPGIAGPDHIVVDKNGEAVADLRDQVFICRRHQESLDG